MNFTIFQEGVGPDFGRVLQGGLIEGFLGGEEDTRPGNVNKSGEIWLAIIE
jgi:hypothetical protein